MHKAIFVALLSLLFLAPREAAAQNAPARELRPLEQLRVLAGVYQMLLSDHVTKLDGPELVYHAIRGMVRGADPEGGEFYGSDDFKQFREGRKVGEVAIGMQIRPRNGQLMLAPLSGGSATEAGVRLDDVLHAVDGKRVSRMQVHEISSMLRGPEGSKVTLTVFRESSLTVETIAVERKAEVEQKPSLSRPSPGVALLRIPTFNEATLRSTVDILLREWQSEPIRAMLLDLRGCPGGLLEVANALSTIFLPENVTVVRMAGRLPEANFVYRASKEFYQRQAGPDPLAGLPAALKTVPLAVLVDNATTSGAEIVAAALQDNRRAVIVGKRTYGRGSIQTVRPLGPTEGVKVTTAYWTSPNGKTIHGEGVTPDIEAESPEAVQAAVRKLLAQ